MTRETYDDPAAFRKALGTAQRSAKRRARQQPRATVALVRERGEQPRRTKLSLARAQKLGWQFGFVQGRGHYAWRSGDGRRVEYAADVPALLDALYDAGER